VGDVASSWLTGIKVSDVRLVSPPTEPEGKPSELRIDEARARLSLLPLLVGRQTVSFNLSMLGGSVQGSASQSGKDRSVELELDGLNMSEVGPVTAALGLPVEGRLTGTVKVTLTEGKAAKANGSLNIEIRDMAVGDGKAKLKGALALPRVAVGNLNVVGDIKDGQLKLSKLAAGGKDVELDGQGRVQLRDQVMDSGCDLTLKFKINDNYRTKNDVTKSLFGAPGSTAPALFDLDPKVKQSKRPDGFYGWAIRGAFSRLDAQPAPNVSKSN
jgi:type II secretion system protein N